MIPFRCPECDSPIKAPDELSGTMIICGECLSSVVVPVTPRQPKQPKPRSVVGIGFKFAFGAIFGIFVAYIVFSLAGIVIAALMYSYR